MGTGYVRQSAADIVTGAVVEAAPLNLEFNQLRDAFHETSGHAHDGTTGEGPKIALTTSISGVLPVVNGGFAAIHKINGTAAPTVNEDSGDGYGVGSIWLDTTNDKAYICVDATVAAAIWLTIGTATGFQPLDTDLTAIAALISAADKMPYATGAGTWALADLSAFARTLLDDANAAALLTTLGITSSVAELNYTDGVTSAIQTQLDAKQASDAGLTSLAGLATTDKIYYLSAADTWSAVTIGGNMTFAAGTLDAVASSLDATLTAMAGVVTAADTGIYFTGVDVAAGYTLTSFARTLLDDANQAAARTTLGLTPGTDVQAYDAELAAIAGLTSAADRLPYFTGSGTAALATFTTAGRNLIDDASASDQRTTLGLGTLATASSVTTSEIAAATLVTAADTIASNDNDTTIPTTAAIIDYVGANGGASLTVSVLWSGTASGATYAMTGLGTTHKALLIVATGLSHDAGSGRFMRIALSDDNGATYGTANTFGLSMAAADTKPLNLMI